MAERENTEDWLSIARSFKPSTSGDQSATPSNERPAAPKIGDKDYEINEINEERLRTDTAQPLDAHAQASEYLAKTYEIDRALGVSLDSPGDYDHKATVAGGMPPSEEVLALQEWLAKIDWRYGLRCGKYGHQCRACKGVPCWDSAAWEGATDA